MKTIFYLSDSQDFKSNFTRPTSFQVLSFYQIFKICFCAHQLVERPGFDDRSAFHEDDPITLAQELERKKSRLLQN